jgi:hypothetical protein
MRKYFKKFLVIGIVILIFFGVGLISQAIENPSLCQIFVGTFFYCQNSSGFR